MLRRDTQEQNGKGVGYLSESEEDIEVPDETDEVIHQLIESLKDKV